MLGYRNTMHENRPRMKDGSQKHLEVGRTAPAKNSRDGRIGPTCSLTSLSQRNPTWHLIPFPTDYPRVTPYLAIDGAADAIEFYKKAFGATERMRLRDSREA